MEIGGGRSGEREGSHAWICPAPIDLKENLNPGNMKDYVQHIEQCGESVSIFFCFRSDVGLGAFECGVDTEINETDISAVSLQDASLCPSTTPVPAPPCALESS